MINIGLLFGEEFLKKSKRIESYDFIESFIAQKHVDWGTAPNTLVIVKAFEEKLEEMNDKEFAFLLTHSGYIPENYKADSSQETLYSKLTEALVLEWAKRIGFKDSVLPSQKASMEDVSIMDDRYVIVCDAKSFRLGRSQKAPNVKDVLKHSDIAKWLSSHHNHERLGGLITFPSQHDWTNGSDYYQYLTDTTSPTISLYYEQLAYLLLFKINKQLLIDLYANHSSVFPDKIDNKRKNREIYHQKLISNLFSCEGNKWDLFNTSAQKIISEMVFHTIHILDLHIENIKDSISKKYENINDIELLRNRVIESESQRATEQLSSQTDRISRFRTPARDYHEE